MAMPFLKFYPRDWLADEKLRLCSLAARGLWFEMLCMMHQGARRGYLESGPGKPVTTRQLAVGIRIAEAEAAELVEELDAAGVFSRDANGVIYSRRMVADSEFYAECAEAGKKSAARSKRAGGGRFGKRTEEDDQGTDQGSNQGVADGRPRYHQGSNQGTDQGSNQGTDQGSNQGTDQGSSKVRTKVAPSLRRQKAEGRRQKAEEDKTPQPPAGGDDPKPKAAGSVPVPAELDTPEFLAAWSEWLAERDARKKPVTARSAAAQLAALAPLGAIAATECVQDSIRNNWQGLFPAKFRPRGGGGGGNLLDFGAKQESRMLAQCAEALRAP